jgi:acyl carrier protein
MRQSEVLGKIEELLGEMAAAKGASKPRIRATTLLLGGGLPIDSLDLAGLVVELELATGLDPFKDGFVEFRTAGELADLYSREP